MRGVSRTHLTLGILGIVVLTASAVGITLAVSARPSSAVSSPTVVSYSGTSGRAVAGTAGAGGLAGLSTGAVSAGSTSPAATYPIWCCSGGSPLGLTATGQATVSGTGAAARSSAVAKAVAEAESQARAAATEAGISLGRIINLDVSAPYYPYPLPIGLPARASGPSTAPAAPGVSGISGSSGQAIACPYGSPCPYFGISTFATVTVTWAIS